MLLNRESLCKKRASHSLGLREWHSRDVGVKPRPKLPTSFADKFADKFADNIVSAAQLIVSNFSARKGRRVNYSETDRLEILRTSRYAKDFTIV